MPLSSFWNSFVGNRPRVDRPETISRSNTQDANLSTAQTNTQTTGREFGMGDHRNSPRPQAANAASSLSSSLRNTSRTPHRPPTSTHRPRVVFSDQPPGGIPASPPEEVVRPRSAGPAGPAWRLAGSGRAR